MLLIGKGIAPQSAHKQPFVIVTSSSFSNFIGIFWVLFKTWSNISFPRYEPNLPGKHFPQDSSDENLNRAKEIIKKVKSRIQIGGGIRTIDDINSWIEMGVDRVGMGTAAVENTDLLETACNKFKNKIAVALDVKDGLIVLSGWKKQTNISAIDYIREIQNFGVSRIVYTDINKDGTKKGPNIKDTVELSSKVKIPLVISGGVSSIEDIKKIKSLNNSNIEGVIVGKSIYDGDIKISDLAELI